MRKEMIEKKEDTIEIIENVKIKQENHDIILEKGDKIQILKEGACTFEVISEGPSMKFAYIFAVNDARQMYGNDPYNGTISTTDGYKEVFPPTKKIDSQKFRSWRNDMIKAAAKWDPAMGVDLGGGKYFFFGWASS